MKFLEYIELNPKVALEKGKEYPFIEMSSVSTQYRNPEFIDIKEFDSGVKFQDGDTVVARITPCLQNGKRFYCKNIGCGFGSTEYLVFRSKDTNIVDNLYLYYFMNTEFIRKSMINSMTGATGRQRVNNDVFNNIDINFPKIKTQRRIADILSAYDDLIENNQKQIKLLEEAAQRLYKEWFVDLRFPGYEQTKIIDGVPEGWKISTLDKVANLKAGGDKPKVYSDIVNSVCKIPIYSNGSENEGLYGYTDKARILEECITISARGNVGYTCLRRTPFVPIVRLISVIPIDIDVIYLYYYLKNLSFDSNGAAQQQITIPMIKEYKVIVPSEEILLEYRKVACSIHDKIDIIKNQNTLLKEARDRLLPKLMSGEIEV